MHACSGDTSTDINQKCYIYSVWVCVCVVASSYVRTLFYLRYQPSSKSVSPSKNQPPPSGMSHSISMDVPNKLAARPPKKGGRVPRSKSLGEPGQLKMARHLAVPVDKHKVSRKKESTSGKFFVHCVIFSMLCIVIKVSAKSIH